MRAVAIRALGSKLVAALGGLAVETLRVLLLLGRMAGAAVDAAQFLRVRELFLGQFLVAVGALEVGVG